MILSKRVSLGGVQLDELHDSIVIRGINPGTPDHTVNAVSRMSGAGQRITGEHWETLEAQVRFAINLPKREMVLRRKVFDLVMNWAAKCGWLTMNCFENRRLYVDKVQFPNMADPWDWTADYVITFKAYNVPFWQDEAPTSASNPLITSGSVQIEVGGNIRSVLDVEFRNRSGMTINNFNVSAGGNTLYLSGIGLGGSSTLNIHHGTDGVLRITSGGSSVLSCRTGADDLYVNPGVVNVSISADRAGQLTVRNYGRYV